MSVRMPSLRLLKGFEAAARLGSFSRAAAELCLSQSAVSHQIQQLEDHIGQPLFSRVGRGVELTVAGEVLLRSVRQSLDALESGLTRIASYLDPGLVVLVCPAPLLASWLQPRLARLQQELPGLCPLLSTDESARYVDELDVDIHIGSRPLQQSGLLEVSLCQDEWLVVAEPALATRLAELPREAHPEHAGVVCLELQLTGDGAAALSGAGLAPFGKRAIYDDERLLLDAARRGLGLACVSRLAASDALATGAVRRVEGYPALPGPRWWLARAAGDTRSPLVVRCFDWLRDEAARGEGSVE